MNNKQDEFMSYFIAIRDGGEIFEFFEGNSYREAWEYISEKYNIQDFVVEAIYKEQDLRWVRLLKNIADELPVNKFNL